MEPAYRVELGRILEDLGEQVDVTTDVDTGVLALGSETFAPLAPAHLEFTLTNTGAGVVGHGTVHVDLEASCARCLRSFVLPVTTSVDSFYVTPGHTADLPEEQEYELINDRSVDIMPAVLSALTLELPFAPLHDPECAGICPVCGTDLNEGPCECSVEGTDSPFSALKDLFPSDDE